MTVERIDTRFQLRRGTSTEWADADPILAAGEPGIDLTTGDLRVGDGDTVWSALPDSAGVVGPTGPPGPTEWDLITDKPTLGTAAVTDAGDYATAAQGAKADSAVAEIPGAALDATLAALPAWTYGDPIRRIRVKPGAYTRTGPIRVPSGVHLSMYGCKFTLDPGANCDVLTNADWAAGNSWITVEGGHLNGNSAAQANVSSPNPGQSGVTLCHVQHVTLRGLFCEDNFRHGIDVTSQEYYTNATSDDVGPILIEGCKVTGYGDDGITTHHCHDVIIRDCTAYDSGTGFITSTHGLEIDDGSTGVLVDGFIAYGNESSGITVQQHDTTAMGVRKVVLNNCYSHNNGASGFHLVSEHLTDPLTDIIVSGCVSASNAQDGLRIESCREVVVTGFTSRGDDSGIRVFGALAQDIMVDGFVITDCLEGIDMAPGAATKAISFANGIIERVQTNGLLLERSDVRFHNILLSDCGLNGTSSTVSIKGTASDVDLSHVTVRAGITIGFAITSGASKIRLNRCVARDPRTGTVQGVQLTGSAATADITITGCRFNGHQRGIYNALTGTITNLRIMDNDLQGNTTSAIAGGTLAGVTLRGNLGYASEAKGTGVVLDTTSALTITHGLGTTPVTVTLGKRTAEDVWVSARTTTTFTVTRTGTAGALTFDWRAEL